MIKAAGRRTLFLFDSNVSVFCFCSYFPDHPEHQDGHVEWCHSRGWGYSGKQHMMKIVKKLQTTSSSSDRCVPTPNWTEQNIPELWHQTDPLKPAPAPPDQSANRPLPTWPTSQQALPHLNSPHPQGLLLLCVDLICCCHLLTVSLSVKLTRAFLCLPVL